MITSRFPGSCRLFVTLLLAAGSAAPTVRAAVTADRYGLEIRLETPSTGSRRSPARGRPNASPCPAGAAPRNGAGPTCPSGLE